MIINRQLLIQCSGCRCCEHICPTNSIHFAQDKEGFLIPYVNEETCIKCEKCVKKCPQINKVLLNTNIKTFAALNRKKSDVLRSSSGGIMSALADKVLTEGGVVFGTYLDHKDWKCKFKWAINENGLEPLRGSKYLQSDTGNSYKEVKEFLEKNITVLYVAVPCQIAGLLSFLGKSYEKLYVVDILCHGAISPDLLGEHINYLEEKYKRKLTDISFRDKSKIPGKVVLKYRFGEIEKCILGKCDKYYMAFISGAAYRKSCYKCKYAQKDRIGDITLGDYWGVLKIHPEFNQMGGASLVLINTEKGMELIDDTNILLVESDLNKAIIGNGILKAPPKIHYKRDSFYVDVQKSGYEVAVNKDISVKPMIYSDILIHLPRWVINFLSKL